MGTQEIPRQRGSEQIWLSAAYDVLTESGVEAVKVMPLAKRVGLSRTSFYWHFRDREALLEAMIRHWEDKNTGNLVARTHAPAGTICAAVFNLYDCWVDDALFDARLDLAIRNWARNDPALQSRLDRADTARTTALAEMFTRFGFDPSDADIRAMTAIYTQIGYISMQVKEDLLYRLRKMPDYVQVLTGRAPTEAEIATFMARHSVTS
ncbi:MAG: TetR/AcrR family transcriptional regulator [Paracoccaceae bacterium]